MHSYDTIIIGAGLTGLLLTHRLAQSGQKVALLDSRETLGARYRRAGAASPYSSPNLDFFPATNENSALLEWVKAVSPLSLRTDIREHRPQIFDEGKWRPFAGFGDTAFQSVGELAHFSHSHELVVEPGLEQLVRALVEQLPVEAATMSEVTSFKSENGRISEVVINGDKSLRGERFVFTPYPSLLNDLLDGEALPAKHRTRLAKLATWTSVTLELTHTPNLADDGAVRVFNHNAKEFEPVVGRVFGADSRWITLAPAERENEHEFIGQCIRHIKRQLKRAWPLAMEGRMEEKIYVQTTRSGKSP
ncbi:MAG: NAD(P)-binding protein [Calothrix sp. SM1_5_4]|nr:NAD(P)-binding protein [Calothrix sp. SM1_5_4]